jgi:Xaa-Pro aminopeptidase
MVKPGVRIGALCEKHDEMMREYGVEDICLTMNNSGHGIGQDIHEMPILKSIFGDKTFKPGMVFAFEPTIIHPVEGQIVLESNYVVTETGCENLTPQLQECIYVPDRK